MFYDWSECVISVLSTTKTFLVQSMYCHLAIKLYCIIIVLCCNHPGRYVPLCTLSSQFRDHPEPPESRRRCRLDVETRQADRERSWSVPRSRHWRRSAEAGLNLKAIDNGPRMVTMDRDYVKTSGLNSRYLV